MKKELNILMLEDVNSDAELVRRELGRSDLSFQFRRVDASDEFVRELKHNPPDVILSDHGLGPQDGFHALTQAQHRHPDVPFIFVTGSLGEEMVIRAFESGAADCVLKHRLDELVPAVKRALRAAEERRKLREAEAECERLNLELKSVHEELDKLHKFLHICSSCKKIRDEHNQWQRMEAYMRSNLKMTFSHGLCPDCIQKFYTGFV